MFIPMQIKRTIEVVLDFPGLGEKIKRARESDPRTLTELCKLSGISRGYWYQVENEDLRAPVSEEVLRKMEKILNVDLEVHFL